MEDESEDDTSKQVGDVFQGHVDTSSDSSGKICIGGPNGVTNQRLRVFIQDLRLTKELDEHRNI